MPRVKLSIGDDSWDVELGRFLNVEIMAIERQTGMTASEFEDALNRGSMTAHTALVWLVRRRTEPGLKFDDVVFNSADLSIAAAEDEALEEGKDEASSVDTVST